MHELQRRVRLNGNPLMDGKRVTWVWEGETAPHLVGDFNNWVPGSHPNWAASTGPSRGPAAAMAAKW